MKDTDKPWVQEMVLVHHVFRRELMLAPALVEVVAPHDLRAASRVGRHLRFVLDGLHVHHSGEDELLWPLLTARATLDAELMARMRAQHDALAGAMSAAGEALSRWRTSVDPGAAATLVAALRSLHGMLCTHLDEEEQRVLPLVTTWITQHEWGRLAEHGLAHMPKSVLFRQLGAILEDADPADRHRFLASVPPPVRLLWAALGRHRYARYTTRLRRGLTVHRADRPAG